MTRSCSSEMSDTYLFLDYLNTRYECNWFNKEVKINNNLSFLYISIAKNNDKFATSIYRKKIFTGLLIIFLFFSPIKYKINLIKTRLHRAFSISSSYCNFHQEVNNHENIGK